MDWNLIPTITWCSFLIYIALKNAWLAHKKCLFVLRPHFTTFPTFCKILNNLVPFCTHLFRTVGVKGKGQLIAIVAGVFFLRLLLTMFAKRWVILKVLREPVSRIEGAEQRSNDCAPSECSCQWGIKGPPVTTWTTHCHHSTLFGTCLVQASRLLQPTYQPIKRSNKWN